MTFALVPKRTDGHAAQMIDVGFRCATQQSSSDPPYVASRSLLPSLTPGGFFFHTQNEHRPWIVIELGRVRSVDRITIWNREEVGDVASFRSIPLSVCISNEGKSWQQVAYWTEPFGGRLSGKPLVLEFSRTLRTAFVKLQVEAGTFFHLDYIEITQCVQKPYFGSVFGFRRNTTGTIECDYLHQAINGLYSGFTTALYDMVQVAKSGIDIASVDLSMSFVYFKDQHDHDVYPDLFAGVEPGLVDACVDCDFQINDIHSHYKELPLTRLKHIASLVFSPSFKVVDAMKEMMAQARVKPEKTIAIFYRGTDKDTEVTLAPIEDYIRVAKALKELEPDSDILVQTDQHQAQAAVLIAFPDAKRFDLPTTTGSTAIHLMEKEEITMSRDEFTMKLIAATQVLARCRWLITHTGNMGAWAAIYRGSSERLFQFDAIGRLVEPS